MKRMTLRTSYHLTGKAQKNEVFSPHLTIPPSFLPVLLYLSGKYLKLSHELVVLISKRRIFFVQPFDLRLKRLMLVGYPSKCRLKPR